MATARQLLSAAAVRGHVKALADPSRAKSLQRFFKTQPGEYAAGDWTAMQLVA
ncbi:MAG TPA: hypothetical protein VIK60_02930 [Vicinamibacterales bacterium]